MVRRDPLSNSELVAEPALEVEPTADNVLLVVLASESVTEIAGTVPPELA